MQFVRMLLWVLILAALVIIVVINWGTPVPVRFWPGVGGDNFLFEWPVGFIALVFLVLGALPPYLLYRGTKWRLNRRISHLEANARASAIAARPIDDFGGTPSSTTSPGGNRIDPAPTDRVNRPLP